MKTALYVGLEAPTLEASKDAATRIIHLPLIKIVPKEASEIATAFSRLYEATHIIVTSKTTVRLAKEHFAHAKKKYISVGKATTAQLQELKVEEIETVVSPVNWVYSVRNMLTDWGAPSWIVNRFSLRAAGALAIFTMVDAVYRVFGRGALLRATLVRPT